MKALEKDRTRRYESANELAKDVQRYLDDEPVEACPPSTAYRLRKFARRNKATMFTVASIMLALILGAGIAAGQAVRATKAERLAKQQERLAVKQQRLAVKQQQLAEEAAERERRLSEEAGAMLLLALQDFGPAGAAFGPDGDFYVVSHGTSRVLRFDGSTGAFISEFVTAGNGGLDHPEGLVFGPDANGDGTDDLYVANGGGNSVLQYDGATGVFLGTFVSVGSGGLAHPTGLTFGPDGNLYVMSFATNSILRYDATDGRFLDEFVPAGRGGLGRPQMGVFGPDGNLYVASFATDSVLRYDGTSGDFMDEFVPPGSGGLSLPEAFGLWPGGNSLCD